jgi:hypothetical protein
VREGPEHVQLAGENCVIARGLSTILATGLFLVAAVDVHAQGAFPAPLPSQTAAPAAAAPANASPFPPVNASGSPAASPAAGSPCPAPGAAPSAFDRGAAPVGAMPGMGGPGPGPGGPAGGAPPGAQECMNTFMPLRQDVEKKAAVIKAAGARRAPPEEACKLITVYVAAEEKMLKYVETNAKKCGIPPEVPKQMKGGHANSLKMKQMVCNAAEQQARGAAAAAPSLSEALGTNSALPEVRSAKRGGAAFETLSGNALKR